MKQRKIHRRYYDGRERPDLRALAKCDNINGPICDAEHLTSDSTEVTCGRCRRIEGNKLRWPAHDSSPPWSAADLRLLSRTMNGRHPKRKDEPT